MRWSWMVLWVAVLSGCGSGQDKEPETPKRASAQQRILGVGKVWQEGSQVEGYPNTTEVAFLRATDRFTLHLQEGAKTAVVDLEREELVRTPQGREFHCNVKGAVQAVVKYAWRLEEPALALRVPASSQQRVCREPGFPQRSRQFEALNAVYVLRGDRLVAVDPPSLRSALLPGD